MAPHEFRPHGLLLFNIILQSCSSQSTSNCTTNCTLVDSVSPITTTTNPLSTSSSETTSQSVFSFIEEQFPYIVIGGAAIVLFICFIIIHLSCKTRKLRIKKRKRDALAMFHQNKNLAVIPHEKDDDDDAFGSPQSQYLQNGHNGFNAVNASSPFSISTAQSIATDHLSPTDSADPDEAELESSRRSSNAFTVSHIHRQSRGNSKDSLNPQVGSNSTYFRNLESMSFTVYFSLIAVIAITTLIDTVDTVSIN